jgi:hypothetical protein
MLNSPIARAEITKGLVKPLIVAALDPATDHTPSVMVRAEVVLPDALLLQTLKNRSMTPFCSGVCGVMNSCFNR